MIDNVVYPYTGQEITDAGRIIEETAKKSEGSAIERAT
jgi:hypothetical protein